MNKAEKAIANAAVAALMQLGFKAEARSGDEDEIDLDLRRGGRRVRLRGEIRREMRPFVAAMIVLRWGGDKKRVVISEYISPSVAEALRSEGVQFVDAAGNMFLESSAWIVFINGKRPAIPVSTPTTPRVFSRGGLATTFALLSAPSLVGESVRSIAAAADVSIGTVAHTLTGLRKLGFVEEVRKSRRLFHRDRLIDQWTDGYARTLHPKLELGRFVSRSREWWRDATIADYGAQWGGETAAAALQRHLIPQRGIVYTDAIPRKLIVGQRLRADEAGNVVIRRRFWNALPSPRKDVVPALLIYADLVVEGDARSLTAAREIRDAYLR